VESSGSPRNRGRAKKSFTANQTSKMGTRRESEGVNTNSFQGERELKRGKGVNVRGYLESGRIKKMEENLTATRGSTEKKRGERDPWSEDDHFPRSNRDRRQKRRKGTSPAAVLGRPLSKSAKFEPEMRRKPQTKMPKKRKEKKKKKPDQPPSGGRGLRYVAETPGLKRGHKNPAATI